MIFTKPQCPVCGDAPVEVRQPWFCVFPLRDVGEGDFEPLTPIPADTKPVIVPGPGATVLLGCGNGHEWRSMCSPETLPDVVWLNDEDEGIIFPGPGCVWGAQCFSPPVANHLSGTFVPLEIDYRDDLESLAGDGWTSWVCGRVKEVNHKLSKYGLRLATGACLDNPTLPTVERSGRRWLWVDVIETGSKKFTAFNGRRGVLVWHD